MSRICLITGAGGMGRAIARRLVDGGDVVTVADVDHGALAAAAAELPSLDTIRADVSGVDGCEQMVAETVSRHGGLDVLIGTAGVWTEGPAELTSEDQWDRTVDVNLKGAFFSCRFAIPHLVRSRGSIVLVSSDYGLVGGPNASVYAASKFGVNGIVRSLALELAPRGVRVNGVCPTDVDTPMLAGQARDFGAGDADGYLRRLLETLPQGDDARFIQPQEVAALVVFLCSVDAAPITGACIPIDWGVTAGS